jgi:hypothetical protein
MPKIPPVETGVVETGSPNREAPATSSEVARFAASPCPSSIGVLTGGIASARILSWFVGRSRVSERLVAWLNRIAR